jgi:predicted O-linked N-acetylglucosamine transferase (SPINDLY family)
VYGSATRFMKLNERVIELWAGILQAVPGARLSILDAPEHPRAEFVRARFAGAGVADRVELHPTLRDEQYWNYLAGLDIALDPFPYTGATTTFDCLWMEVPVVTLAGDCGSARSAASIVRAMGLPELCAATPGEYVAAAVALGRDADRLARLRRGLRRRVLESPCGNPAAFTANLENLYRSAWEQCGDALSAAGAA